ncbi:MAG: hypothetical protein CMH58_02255 [Myxococcales bacterium]|nr:hypothetical protein [Myxococcales bacterium]|tara:strand:+ start:306 stop:527 length:222 start_codon:yes stop_codon:yes gene_type:complete
MNGTFEDQSVEFLHGHMDGSFQNIMSAQVISRLEWLDFIDCEYRPIAVMYKEAQDYESNHICLFPPFIPEGER